MRGRTLVKLVLAAATVCGFTGAGHYAADRLIHFQQAQQLADISRVALRRAEAAVDYASAGMAEILADGPISCDPKVLQTVRFNVYRRGAIKDIRVTDAAGEVLCSAYPETLEFDQGWTTRDEMLETRDPTLRLFRVDQFFGTALGIYREETGTDGRSGGLAAILGLSGATLDIMPPELQDRSIVTLELSDGRAIAQTVSALDENVTPTVTITQSSERLPLRAVVKVDRAALGKWAQEPYWPIMALALALGALFAALLWRVASRPEDPVRELDKAIAAGEFKPFLQPIFDLASGVITGAEILARRVLADGSVIPPSRFVELAESSGRIGQITWVLLSQALADLAPLFRRDPDFRVSVNIAPRHFEEAGFIHDLERTVAGAGVAASRITLELTEREPFEDTAKAIGMVQLIRARGFRVALDDVGTGHSGLSQIQSLRADVLKIDKFFVDALGRDQSATLMVEMLVRIAAEMQMGVVAEGIEEEAQAAALRACGVASGQGYLVSPPLPAAGFLQFIDERAMREALVETDEGGAAVRAA